MWAITAAAAITPTPMNALTGQGELNGTSIVDVTDPKQPKYLAHIPGAVGDGEAGAAQMTRVCDGRSLGKGDPNRVYLLRAFGREGHETYDVTDPGKPRPLARMHGPVRHPQELIGNAKVVSPIWFPRRPAGELAWFRSMTSATRPFRSRFGIFRWSGSSPARPARCPPPFTVWCRRAPKAIASTLAFGTNKGGIMQIVDREKLLKGPKEPTPDNLLYPQIGRLDMSPLAGAHTAMPLGKFKIPEFAKEKEGASASRHDCQRDVP